MTEEEFSKVILECREIVKSEKHEKCPCVSVKCEWHGKCHECVKIHRVMKDHVPNCMKPILKSKVMELANALEADLVPRKDSPAEYWDYVKETYPEEK